MTDQRLERLRQLDAAATPAPWVLWDRSDLATGGSVSAGGFAIVGDTGQEPAAGVYTEADAEWLATARRVIPATIDLLELVLDDQGNYGYAAAHAVLDQIGEPT